MRVSFMSPAVVSFDIPLKNLNFNYVVSRLRYMGFVSDGDRITRPRDGVFYVHDSRLYGLVHPRVFPAIYKRVFYDLAT